MTRTTRILSIAALLLSGVIARAEIGPLNEQQKKDFLETLKSTDRSVRLFRDAIEKKSKNADEIYEKMYALVSRGCKFSENKYEKDGVKVVELSAAIDQLCPVVMKAVETLKKLDESVSERTSEIMYQANEVVKQLNDIFEVKGTGTGKTVHAETETERTYHIERNAEGTINSQKFGTLPYKILGTTDATHTKADKSVKVHSESVLVTQMSGTDIELKVIYHNEGGQATKEVILNGEKIELGSDITFLE